LSFLKKLGNIIATVAGIFAGFAPILEKTVPATGQVLQVVNKDLAAVADAVTTAEALGQMSGMDGAAKAKYVAPIVAQIILSGSIVAGKKIANQALFLQGCGNLGGAVADILNSLHEDSTSAVVSPVKT
jgi:hypothetical protein